MIDREKYRLYAMLPRHQKAVERANRTIGEALKKVSGQWGVSFSGGKDSTVVLDLLVSYGLRPPMFLMTYGELGTGSGNCEMAEHYSHKHNLPLYEYRAYGTLDAWEDVGFFETPETPEQKAAYKKYLHSLTTGFDEFIAGHGVVGTFWGMRAQESLFRRMVAARHGPLYQAQSRKIWTALPTLYWQAADIWAYIVSRDLRYNPIYDQAEDCEKQRNEDVIMFADFVVGRGAWAQLKKQNPDKFYRIAEKYPEIRRYV